MDITGVKEIKFNTVKKAKLSLSYIDRLNEGENANDLFDELLDTFQSQKKQTERSLKYYLAKCIENEATVLKIKKVFNPQNRHSVKITTVKIILRKVTRLKEKFEQELNRRCITKQEYSRRIRTTLDLQSEYSNNKESVEILKHIFLDNAN
jgi:hypothetical protein